MNICLWNTSRSAGRGDIVSSADRSCGFIGWQRLKFGWLDNDRETYLTRGSHKLTFTPLDGGGGLSMVVVPADDPARQGKVFVLDTVPERQHLANRLGHQIRPLRWADRTAASAESVRPLRG